MQIFIKHKKINLCARDSYNMISRSKKVLRLFSIICKKREKKKNHYSHYFSGDSIFFNWDEEYKYEYKLHEHLSQGSSRQIQY